MAGDAARATLQVNMCLAHSPQEVTWLMALWRPEVWSKVAGTVATLLFRDPVSQVTAAGIGR